MMNNSISAQPKQINTEGGVYSIFCVTLFALLPLLYSRTIFDPTQNPHIIGGLFLIVVFCFTLFRKQVDFKHSFGLIDIAWIGYIGFSLQGGLHSRDTSIAFFELGKIVFSYFLYILFLPCFKQKNSYLFSSLAVSLVSVFQMAVVICQKNIGWDIFGSSSNLYGTMTHSNVLSECIIFIFPLTIYGILRGKKVERIISVAGFISSFFLIVILKTRAIWVSFAIATIVILALLVKTNTMKSVFISITRYKKLIIITASGILLLLTTFVFHDVNDFRAHIQSLLRFDSSGRTTIWASTIPIIKEHFWFGVGVGNFRFYIPKTIGAFIQRPHNDYLWICSEAGIFGLLAFVAICLLMIKKIIDNIKTLHGEKLIISYIALFGIITYLVDSFFAFPKERPYNLVFFAFFIAIPFAISPSKSISTIQLKVLAPLLISISIFFLIFNCYRYNGERLLKAFVSNSDLTPQERLCKLQAIKPWAYKADPFSIPIKHYEAMALLGMGNVTEAKKCFFDAYKIYPYQPDVLLNLGTACEITGERKYAKRFYREAIASDGNDIRPKLNLAVVEY